MATYNTNTTYNVNTTKTIACTLLHSNNKNNNIQIIQVEKRIWFRQPGNHCWRLQAHSLINSEKVKEAPIYEKILDLSSLFDNNNNKF